MKIRSVKIEIIVTLVSIQAILALTLYIPSMPFIVQDLGIDEFVAKQAVSFFVLGQAIVPLFLGYLADRFGYKMIMVISMLIFAASCFLMFLIYSGWGILLSRFLQGGFSQAGITISRAMIREHSSYEETVVVLSWIAVIQSITHLIGPFLGGLIIENYHWTVCFYFLLAIAFATTFITIIRSEANTHQQKLHNNIVFSNVREILFSHKFLIYSFVVSTLHLSTIFFISMSPFYFINFCKISPHVFGFYLSITTFGYILGSFIMSRYLHRFDHNNLVIMCLYSGLLCGLVALFSAYYNIYLIGLIIITQFVYAFVKAVISPILQSKALSLFPEKRAISSAAFNFISTISAPIGSVFASIFDYNTTIFGLAFILIFCSIIDIYLFFKTFI